MFFILLLFFSAGTAELKVDLSSTILLGLDSSVESLLEYPYGCLEQRLSRLVPLLLAEDLMSTLELSGWNQEKVKVKVQESLDQIPGYADSSGVCSPSSCDLNPTY